MNKVAPKSVVVQKNESMANEETINSSENLNSQRSKSANTVTKVEPVKKPLKNEPNQFKRIKRELVEDTVSYQHFPGVTIKPIKVTQQIRHP